MITTRFPGVMVLLAMIGLSVGCNAQWATPERYEKGLIIVLPGIEGVGPLNLSICDGLYAGGVEGAIELTGWGGGPLGFVINQRDEVGNRRRAAEIADRIVEYQNDYPDQPVILIGHSGGTAIAAWTAEAMPDDHQVTGLILLASSLSAEYNLCNALERTTQGIVNFYSTRDTILLGAGTGAVGTMDGRHSPPAGRVGFDAPEILAGSWAYESLYNVAWTERMQMLNHIGGHSGYSGSVFVKAVVAPLIREPVWSTEIIESLIVAAVEDRKTPTAIAAAEKPDDTEVATADAASSEEATEEPAASEELASATDASSEEVAEEPVEDAEEVADTADDTAVGADDTAVGADDTAVGADDAAAVAVADAGDDSDLSEADMEALVLPAVSVDGGDDE